MANIFTSEKNSDRQPRWTTVLRIALGLILFWKAVRFIRDAAAARMLIERTGIELFSRNSDILAFVISYLGLLCGLFIAIGLQTRIASILQIPVLLIAVFFVNIKNIGDNVLELLLSIITLLLLIFFAIKGSGPISLDDYFRKGAAIDRNSSTVPL